MKNFKFNAITALIIGVNVAVANAADGNILNITTQDAVNANKTIEATNVKRSWTYGYWSAKPNLFYSCC